MAWGNKYTNSHQQLMFLHNEKKFVQKLSKVSLLVSKIVKLLYIAWDHFNY